jgi:hypothetical protein
MTNAAAAEALEGAMADELGVRPVIGPVGIPTTVMPLASGSAPPPTWVKVLGVALNLVIIGVIVAIVLLD